MQTYPFAVRRLVAVSLAVMASFAVLAAAAQRADAYRGIANCTTTSAQSCFVGNGYQPVTHVRFSVWFAARPEVCAKARTAAGYIRGGSGCNYNTGGRLSGWDHPDPYSGGYGYWGGSGNSYSVSVTECSPADAVQYCIN